MIENFRAGPVLAQLKDFQRASVEHAFDQLYGPTDASRFLIADEVGLGKTMVARGIIAKAIEHLATNPDLRIDIVYICSNQAIAQQNIRRLNVIPDQGFTFSSRMTMIAQQVGDLEANRVNFVSFTPGTSFDLKSAVGMSSERVLIYWLLHRLWGPALMEQPGARRLLKCGVHEKNWDGYVQAGEFVGSKVDKKLIEEYADDLNEIGAFGRYAGIARAFRCEDSDDLTVRSLRDQLIGELRTRLATRCVQRLEPDLVVLDEFQRFHGLMRDDNEAGQLAQSLFDYAGNKTLMLSATPYKMYTSHADEDDDHHRDFIDTIHFLLDGDHAGFDQAMKGFRDQLLDVHAASASDLRSARQAVETELKKVMVRTERLGAGGDRNGMLVEHIESAALDATDISSFVAFERAAKVADAGTTLEYWKSVPLFANFMAGYKVDDRIQGALVDQENGRATKALMKQMDRRIDWQSWRNFGPVDSGNSRFRLLAEQTADKETWRMLWLAPSLPYHELGDAWAGERGSFTKRLIFSTWSGVPKSIASLLSYEVERQMFALRDQPIANTSEARTRIPQLLRFPKDAGSMTSFLMVYPSPALAELGDPLDLFDESDEPPSLESVRAAVAERIAAAVSRLVVRTEIDEERVDQRWYWAAPLLLDRAANRAKWMSHKTAYAGRWLGGAQDADDDSNFGDHIDLASAMYSGELPPLGRQPDDLIEALTDIALGAPGVVALRSLSQVFGSESSEWARIQAAARLSWGFRSLFNLPDVNSLIRSRDWEQDYWRTVTQYCTEGCLTAVLDEYLHVLRESLGFYKLSRDDDGARDLLVLADAASEAINIRTTSLAADDHLGEADVDSPRFRTRYAMRFGSDRAETAESVVTAEHLRSSFNSPFWPFVLATTSVGQEGLDFHLYCHAIVHWNLPHNPVDLEQREGRIHRYKGHAIRRNVAAAHADAARMTDGDPWAAMFAAAVERGADDENDLNPYWIYPGAAKIERHVPMLPLSREVAKLARLKRDVARYRLVFGQARQDDLMEYLGAVPPEKLRELRIDLAPAPVGPLDWVGDEQPGPIVNDAPDASVKSWKSEPDRWTLPSWSQ